MLPPSHIWHDLQVQSHKSNFRELGGWQGCPKQGNLLSMAVLSIPAMQGRYWLSLARRPGKPICGVAARLPAPGPAQVSPNSECRPSTIYITKCAKALLLFEHRSSKVTKVLCTACRACLSGDEHVCAAIAVHSISIVFGITPDLDIISAGHTDSLILSRTGELH